jgi:hypothetical protein
MASRATSAVSPNSALILVMSFVLLLCLVVRLWYPSDVVGPGWRRDASGYLLGEPSLEDSSGESHRFLPESNRSGRGAMRHQPSVVLIIRIQAFLPANCV